MRKRIDLVDEVKEIREVKRVPFTVTDIGEGKAALAAWKAEQRAKEIEWRKKADANYANRRTKAIDMISNPEKYAPKPKEVYVQQIPEPKSIVSKAIDLFTSVNFNPKEKK